MKNLFLIAFAISFAALSRADSQGVFTNPDTSFEVNSLDYMAHLGHFQLRPSTLMSINDMSRNTRTSYSTFSLSASGGFFKDGLRFGVAETEEFLQITNTTSSSSGQTTPGYSGGFSNPIFRAQYRYHQAMGSGASKDIELNYSPNLFDHYVAKKNQDGNYAAGYSTFAILAPFWWTTGSNQIGFTPSVIQYYQGSNIAPAGQGTTDTAPYSKVTFLFQERYHFFPYFFLHVEATLNVLTSYEQTNRDTGISSTTTIPYYLAPKLAVGYKANEHFLIEPILAYQNYTSTSKSDRGTNTSSKNILATFGINAVLGF